MLEENQPVSAMVGNTADAPFMNYTLIANGTLVTNYFATNRPSEPN